MTWLFSIGLHNAAVAIVLALLVCILTRAWKNPPVAHLMWLLVLVKLVTPPVVKVDLSNWISWPAPAGHEQIADLSSRESQPIVKGARLPISLSPEIVRSDAESNPVPDDHSIPAESGDSRPVLPEKSAQLHVPAQLRITAAATWNAISPVLPWIWMGGAGLLALLAGIRIVRFQRTLAGLLPASQRLQSVADELAIRMGLRRSPEVRVVDGVAAPLVWCLGRRATVILPLRLLGALDEQQTAMVLTHELAHLRRRDHWVRVIELVVSVLYWWNPVVWWVRRRLHVAEEQCCDAWVAWAYPDRSHDYAQSLLKAAELTTSHSSRLVLASPFLNTNTLKERIEIVLKNCTQRTTSRRAAVCLALLAAVVIPAGVRGAAEGHGQKGEEQRATTSPKAETKSAPAPVAESKKRVEKPADDGARAKPAPVQNAIDEKAIGTERSQFAGTFNFDEFQSERWTAKPEELQTWQWIFQVQEILWTRPNLETVRLSYTVDPTASPRQIDLTFLNGSDKGEKCQGIYFSSRHEIVICFQDPGAKVGRPTNSGSKPGSRHTSITLVPARILPVAEEVEALQGLWKFDIYYSDWWPERISNPPMSWSKWRWTVTGNEIRWTGMKVPDVTLSFTVDPSKSPRQIDLTFLDGPHTGKTLRGMYKFYAEDGCYICFADPNAKANRPNDVSYSTNSGQTMVSIERMAPEQAAAEAAPAKANGEGRGPEIDVAIARLRRLGAFVREFHPRGDPQYWVQIISTGLGATTRESAANFDDATMADVEIIGRGVALQLHLRNTSVTTAGLARLVSAGRIDMLELTGPNVDNALLKILPKLPLPGSLGLSSDLLTYAGIQTVSECRQLTFVSLDGALLGDPCLEHLTGLPNLHGVSLGKGFTSAAFDILGRLEGLTDLDASTVSPRLSDLVKVPKLRTISLSGKESDDETALTIANTFQSLEEAYLRRTSITNVGVQHLSRLEKLKTLTLDGSAVDDGMADSIRQLKQLKWLSVGDCQVGDDTLAAVSECPDLWYLFLVNTQVTDKGIAHLAKLKKPLNLYLAHCKFVTDDSIKSLAQLPDSENLHLNLQGSGITENGARELQAALPHAQISWGIPAVQLKK